MVIPKAVKSLSNSKLQWKYSEVCKNDQNPEKILFRCEILISIAYCDALFEAGSLNRLECEKVKNALLTILKRKEFDKNYFVESKGQNIFDFISQKLFNLVGETGLKICIGRGYNDRSSTVLRFWLSREVVEISGLLRSVQKSFINLAENQTDKIVFIKDFENSDQCMYLMHWCLSHFETVQTNRERLDEVWRRISTMPLGANEGLGTSLEYDRDDLARKLGFERVANNSLEVVRNNDYILEFINVTCLLANYFILFNQEYLINVEKGCFQFESGYESIYFSKINSKLLKIFACQTELNQIFQASFHNKSSWLNRILEILQSVIKEFLICLEMIIIAVDSLSFDEEVLEQRFKRFTPTLNDIFDYLIDRNGNFESARIKAHQIKKYFESKDRELLDLADLQLISSVIEKDIIFELEIENNLNNKNQIGGSSFERGCEALSEAKKYLQYEE